MSKPLAIDLFCGLGGWTKGFLDEGYDCVGFDIERHRYKRTVNGGDRKGYGGTWFHNAETGKGNPNRNRDAGAVIPGEWVEYPGQLVLQDILTLHGSQFRGAACIVASPPCQEYSYMAMPFSCGKNKAAEYRNGTRDKADLTRLFDACFRIQREASEAAERYIPLIVENVLGAQRWVGRAAWHYGSFYLWGDVPALMPFTRGGVKVSGLNWSGSDKPGYKAQAFNTTAEARLNAGLKTVGHANIRDGHTHTRHLTNQRESDAIKNGKDWFGSGDDCSAQRRHASGSTGRKAASAAIAEIPYDLANHIARIFKPERAELFHPQPSSQSPVESAPSR